MKKTNTLIFFLLLFTFACSRLDLAVKLANSYITNKADNFFDLTWDQNRWLKEALAKDINKIKKTVFPQLAVEMLKVADLLSNQKNFDSNIVMMSYSRLEGLYYDGLRILSPTATAFVDKLRPAQIEYFQKEVDKKFLEMKEDPKKKSYNKIKKHFDSWMGGMTSMQKQELKKFIENNPPPVNEIVYGRQQLVHEFIRAYPDSAVRRLFIEELFTKYHSVIDSNYKKMIEEKNKRVADFFANVLNKISDDQKQTLIETIRDRAHQIIKISKD